MTIGVYELEDLGNLLGRFYEGFSTGSTAEVTYSDVCTEAD